MSKTAARGASGDPTATTVGVVAFSRCASRIRLAHLPARLRSAHYVVLRTRSQSHSPAGQEGQDGPDMHDGLTKPPDDTAVRSLFAFSMSSVPAGPPGL
uniref:Uncharacterized protein n=1 Tax=Plectus sambesii TaxID=2011161 RepID=A0A914W792_9BILA